MIRRVVTLAAALALGAAAGRTAGAGAVTFTGNVDADMPVVPGNGVYAVPGLQPSQVSQDAWITQNGWTNGWVIKDLRFDYNNQTNSMQVGVNFYSIAGDADGNPTGTPAAKTLAEGGSDPASLGGRKSISVEFAAPAGQNGGQVGSPVIVAGVPADKTQAGTGTDGFNVAIAGSNPSIQNNYGASIPWANGNLAFDPSPAHPDFEFTIKDWSAFKNLAGNNGFYISAYAGSPDDVVAGESNLGWIHIPSPFAPAQQLISPGQGTPPSPSVTPSITPNVPEPASVAGWGLLTLGAGWALRRKRKQTTTEPT